MIKNVLILIAFVLVASTSNWAPVYTDVTLTGQGTEDSPLKVDTSRVATAYDLAGAASGASYDVYTALLTQSGTDAPVATVLENTLGGTVVWSYESTGTYRATLSGVFTSGKTAVPGLPNIDDNTRRAYVNNDGDEYRIGCAAVSTSILELSITDGSGSFSNGVLGSYFFEIRVYP
jgi:hypothetical protein